MIKIIRNPSRLIMMTLVMLMLVSAGCKSKKKAMEAQAAEKAKQEELAKQEREKQRLAELEKQKAADAEKARQEAEAMLRNREPKAKLQEYFNAISNAGSFASANSSISEALALFSSESTPVLIVISESGGQKDYDRPTTIKDYFNYLKDQKKKADKIGELKYNSSGKITEVELIKEK